MEWHSVGVRCEWHGHDHRSDHGRRQWTHRRRNFWHIEYLTSAILRHGSSALMEWRVMGLLDARGGHDHRRDGWRIPCTFRHNTRIERVLLDQPSPAMEWLGMGLRLSRDRNHYGSHNWRRLGCFEHHPRLAGIVRFDSDPSVEWLGMGVRLTGRCADCGSASLLRWSIKAPAVTPRLRERHHLCHPLEHVYQLD